MSYVRNNKRLVNRLYNDLTSYGVKVWLDRNDINPGTYWKEAIRQAIGEGVFFIACFSIQYNKRPKTYMNEELILAVEELRQRVGNNLSWFIPVLFSRCKVPNIDIGAGKTLRDIEYIELYRDWDAGIHRILNVIQPIPAPVRSLIEVLQSDYSSVRAFAVEALGNTGHKAVLPPLINALDDNYNVCHTAVDALIRIGTDAVPALIQAMSDGDDYVRLGASAALIRIGNPTAVPALIELLDIEDIMVRCYATSVLEQIGTSEALQAVEEYNERYPNDKLYSRRDRRFI